ncbi:hypothetical protein ABZ468_52515 [Streptomyces sp. NPDC005708]|uniref:hypothetical protein n=1 Tax=Streptomyces sp. NPDC005708 TaxID=3154564 RepID=UPI0033FDFCC8
MSQWPSTLTAGGRRQTRPLTVKNDANLIGVLLKWIRTTADGAPVTWAIEDGRGFARRLADGLLLAGHEVVWVPTRLTAAHRKTARPHRLEVRPRRRCRGRPRRDRPPAWTVTALIAACASRAFWSTHGPTSPQGPGECLDRPGLGC